MYDSLPLIMLAIFTMSLVGAVHWLGRLQGRNETNSARDKQDAEKRRRHEEEEKARAAAEVAARAAEDAEDEGDDFCLHPGLMVRCNLSDYTHTHGVIVGFTTSQFPDGPMLAMVNLGYGTPIMPIDVDRVVPNEVQDGGGGGGPYREAARSAEPESTEKVTDKQWN